MISLQLKFKLQKGIQARPSFRMQFSLSLILLLAVGFSTSLPMASPGEGGIRNTLTKAVKDKAAKAVSSKLECLASNCHGPFYYCSSRYVFTTRCRFTALTWFLMIGLPLIVIGIIVGVYLYKKRRYTNIYSIKETDLNKYHFRGASA